MEKKKQFDEQIKDFMLKAKGKVHYDNVFREFKDRFNTPNATWSYLDKYFVRAGKGYFIDESYINQVDKDTEVKLVGGSLDDDNAATTEGFSKKEIIEAFMLEEEGSVRCGSVYERFPKLFKDAKSCWVYLDNHFKRIGKGFFIHKNYYDDYMKNNRISAKDDFIFATFGKYWRAKSGKKFMIGKATYGNSSKEVDFTAQNGIYFLHDDNKKIIYIGKATKTISTRIAQHTKDRFAGKWSSFSWFGYYGVDENTGKLKTSKMATNEMGKDRVIDFFEAIFIEMLDDTENQKSGNNFDVEEYSQCN
jgi:GIY-YIG catalytic domain protein